MHDISLKQALKLLDMAPQPMLLLEESGTVRGFNSAFRALVGEEAGDASDLSLDPGLLQPLLGTSTVVNWIMPGGDERWLAIDVLEVPELPGMQARFYPDITEKLRLRHERDALEEELEQQTLHDRENPGLLSRRGLLVSLAPLVARCRRYNSPLSIIALTAHGAANTPATMLADITSLLRDQTRWADLLGRNSDAAFILVLQETTRDAALEMVEKLAGHIDRMNEDSTSVITACYGITECQKHDDAEALLERAEQALAEAATNETGRAIAL